MIENHIDEEFDVELLFWRQNVKSRSYLMPYCQEKICPQLKISQTKQISKTKQMGRETTIRSLHFAISLISYFIYNYLYLANSASL